MSLSPSDSVAVKSRVTGHLLKIHFLDGDEIKAGDLLFTIDPVSLKLGEEQARADLAQDRASAEQAVREEARYKALWAKGVVSREEYEARATAARTALQAVRAKAAGAGIAGRELSYTLIHSPINGVAGQALIDEGNLVKAEDDRLVVVNDVEPVDAAFGAPEKYLNIIRTLFSNGTLKVEAAPKGDDGPPVQGELVFIDNQVDTATGAIGLKARFANKDRRLWPGQFVRVSLYLDSYKGVTLAPETAVEQGPDGSFVYVVEGGEAKIKPVEIVQQGVDQVALKGIGPGQEVVTQGSLRLFDGAKVKVLAPGRANATRPKGAE